MSLEEGYYDKWIESCNKKNHHYFTVNRKFIVYHIYSFYFIYIDKKLERPLRVLNPEKFLMRKMLTVDYGIVKNVNIK